MEICWRHQSTKTCLLFSILENFSTSYLFRTTTTIYHYVLDTILSQLPDLHFNNKKKYSSSFYLLVASLVSLTQAQDLNDSCITCYLGDLFGNFILPAVGKFFATDPPSNLGATNPAQDFVAPQTDPEEQKSPNNVLGITGQPDLEIQIIGEPDSLCNSNAIGVSNLLPIHWPMQNACKI